MSLTYDQLQGRLQEIEADLAERQPEFEQAAEQVHRLAREYELRMARATVASDKPTVAERKADALIAIAASDDDLYQRHAEAEGRYEGLKAAIRTLETRASIGQSLLRQFSREAGPQPAWRS